MTLISGVTFYVTQCVIIVCHNVCHSVSQCMSQDNLVNFVQLTHRSTTQPVQIIYEYQLPRLLHSTLHSAELSWLPAQAHDQIVP